MASSCDDRPPEPAGSTGPPDAGPSVYEIRVTGLLGPDWAAWFHGLRVTGDGTHTTISGPVADQAALHGLLHKVRDLGLHLVSVQEVAINAEGTDDT